MKRNDMARRDFLKVTAAAAVAAGVTGNFSSAAAEAGPKKALQFGMLPKGLSDADKFKLAKACGFEGIEMGVVADLEAAKKYADAAKGAGITIHSVVYGGWDAPFSSGEPAVIDKGLKNFEAAMRGAKAMGADAILLVPAVVDDKMTYDAAYKRSQEHIRTVLPVARELKLIIAVENVWNKFLLSPLEFARYVDEFNDPWLQAYFDTGNVVIFGYPEQWIRILGKRIAKIHLKDFKRKGQEWTNLRDGDVNWPEVRKALGEVGYTGYMTPELSGGDEAYLRDLSARIDKILAGE
jgi:hexulose-6-phosphate isomerase